VRRSVERIHVTRRKPAEKLAINSKQRHDDAKENPDESRVIEAASGEYNLLQAPAASPH